jgi:RNA-directed DNA polymerase
LERIISFSNLQKAYKQVRRNAGSGGVDQMSIKEFWDWFSKHYQEFQDEIQQEVYHPQAVIGIKIPKPKGGFRQLGIPTIKDRVVQQAISQVLQPLF